jgi:gliding motility-associated-like protein
MKKITLMLFLFLIHLSSSAQLANEGFEGSTQLPANWSRFITPVTIPPGFPWNVTTYDANNSFTLPANTGIRSVNVPFEPSTTPNQEKWLVTPAFAMPTNAELHFFSKLATAGDQGTNFRIMISTVVTGTPAAADFVPLQTYTETTLNPVDNVWLEKVISIDGTTYAPGTQVKIAFVLVSGANEADWWLIDDVRVSELCTVPTGLSATPSATSAVLNWTSTSSATTWQVYIPQTVTAPIPVGDVTGSVTVTGSPTHNATGLATTTSYVYYVRSMCAEGPSGWAGPFAFRTTQIPLALPYVEDFEGAGATAGWSVDNTPAQTNKWFKSFRVNNGGDYSLAISNDNSNFAYVNTTVVNVSQAYRDIQMPASVDQLNLTFDWQNVGQNNTTSDYFRVWVVPATFTPTPGTQITAANSGGIQVGGNFGANATWRTENFIVNAAAYSNKVLRLVFEWRNDTFGTTGTPAAIDNVKLSVVTCPSPTNVVASVVTNNSATLTWTAPTSTSPSYNYYYSTTNTPPTATTTPSGTVPSGTNTVTISPLNPTTPYFFWVRSNCGIANGNGIWVAAPSFTTAVGNDDCSGALALVVNPTDVSTSSTKAIFTSTNASSVPSCSLIGNVATINGPDIWFKFTATQGRHNISLSKFTPNGWRDGGQASVAQNIVLSLYDGTCGAVGDPLFCKNDNYIQASDLTPGKDYFVRATINNAAPNLNTTFDIAVTTPPAPSATNQSDCIITTINPSFESPNTNFAGNGTGTTNTTLSHNVVQGWRTTDPNGLIEFWPVPASAAEVNDLTTTATGGTGWVIELNAETVSNVYQDYSTPTQTVFKCKFAHRGRWGVDKCQLWAGAPGGVMTLVAEAETGTAWKLYGTAPNPEITYVVPAGQPVTRFLFQSISSAPRTVGGTSIESAGNLIDDVEFTADNSILSVSKTLLDCSPGNGTTTFVAAGSGVWTAHADNPSPTTISAPDNTTTDVTGFTTPGIYKYDWTTSYCVSTTQVTYANGNTPLPVTGDLTYCQGESVPRLTVDNPLYTVKWYAAASGGIALAGAPTPDTSVTGETTYYVSYIDGSCESARSPLKVTINPLPVAPTTGSLTVYCQGSIVSPVSATVTAGSGNTLVWYNVDVNGTPLAQAPTPNTAVLGPVTYYVSQKTAAGCEGPRAAVEVTIRAIESANVDFTVPASVCIGSTTNPVSTPGADFVTGGTYTYTVATGTGTLAIDAVSGEIDLANSTVGSYYVVYTVAGNPANCYTTGTQSQAIVITSPTPAIVGFSYTDVCSNAANQLPQPTGAALTTGGTFTYTGPGTLAINPATGEINIAGSTSGTYTVTYTVANDVANCISTNTSSATIVITPYVTPVTGFSYETTYCFGTATATPTLNNGFTPSGVFTITGGLTINPTTGEISNLGSASAGQYTVTYSYTGNGSACNPDGASTFTFTVGSESLFTVTGECANGAFVVTGTPTNGSFNSDAVTYAWTIGGVSVGNDSKDFNYSDYARSNSGVRLPVTVTLTVINGSCPTSEEFVITDASCEIQRGISPGSNDELNNFFDLAQLGVKKLSIFNRYGKEVYTKNNYTTEWHGQTNSGDELPTGTYFYSIDLNVGASKTGWIYVNRQN